MALEVDELAGPDGGDEGKRLAAFWLKHLENIRDDTRTKRWIKRGHTIEKRYRDERSRIDEEGQRRYNALWSNVEILTPAIYGKCPTPIVERRFRDKDVVGRGAAQILERGLRNEIEICGFDDAIQQAVRDYLLPGRGTVWVRYEPELEGSVSIVTEGGMDITDDLGEIAPDDDEENPEVQKLQETGDRITRESTPVDYVHWEDFITFPANARIWKEVTAVGKRVYMTRDQMKRRFGPTIGKEIPLKKDDRSIMTGEGSELDPDDKGEIYEIWSLADKAVFWIAEGYDYLCDRKDDPLQLENFFPCPRPIYSNPTTGTLVPVPDYLEYQDQAIQIDELTQRISMLAKACKVAGVYNAAAKDIQRLLQESVENELIPVDDWAAFAEKGGVAGNISLLPLKEIIGVLNELMMIKDKAIQEMDRLTGITDIMRGTTDARETMGGQRLKSNSAGTRLQRRQNEVARFARDTLRIVADIMGQHFSPVSLIEVSGALYEEGLGPADMPGLAALQQPQQAPPPPQQLAPPVSSPAGVPQGAPPNTPPRLGGAPPSPEAQPGSNIVPFKPPGQPSMGAPPQQFGQAPPPQIPPEMQAKMAGLQRISDSIKLIRNERLRGFRVDIEVDSTIYGDMQQDKANRVEFLTSVTQFLEQALGMSMQMPEITPLLGKFLQFGVRGFPIGRDLESAIEEFCDQAVVTAKQHAAAAAQKPNPQDIKAQASMITAQSRAKEVDSRVQSEGMKTQMSAQQTQAKIAADQQKSAAEVQRQALENQGESANSQMDLRMKELDMQMKQMEMEIEKIRLMQAHVQATTPKLPPQEGSLGEGPK